MEQEGKGRRFITDARAVVGELSPIRTLRGRGRREKGVGGRVAKAGVAKVKTRSKKR